MLLRQFAPPIFLLHRWVKSPMQPHTWFVLDWLHAEAQQWVRALPTAAARTHLVQVFNIVDQDDEIMGHMVRHRPMPVSVGLHHLNLHRVDEGENVKVSTWRGEYVSLLEGQNGATLFHHCALESAISHKLEVL